MAKHVGTTKVKAIAKAVTASVVDAALKRAWTQALERLQRAQRDEAAEWDALYETVGDILEHEPPLYLAGGFKTARAFLAKHFPDKDERTVKTYVRVARHFDPADEDKHTVSRLALLLDYLETVNKGVLPAVKIHPERQQVRIAYGKTSKLVPFAKLDADGLRRAARRARAAKGERVTTKEPAVVKRVRAVLRTAHIADVTVSVRQGKVTLGGVVLSELNALGRALAKGKFAER